MKKVIMSVISLMLIVSIGYTDYKTEQARCSKCGGMGYFNVYAEFVHTCPVSSSSSSNSHAHNNDGECNKTHCGESWCTKCPYGHTCGGSCSFSDKWSINSDGMHVRFCTKGDGCTEYDKTDAHVAAWNWTGAHTVTCKTCGLSGKHESSGSKYYVLPNGNHTQACTKTTVTVAAANGKVSVIVGACPTGHGEHSPKWGAYYKVGNAGESNDTATHKRECLVSGCTIMEQHEADYWNDLEYLNEKEHTKKCGYSSSSSTCDLTCTQEHRLVADKIEGNMVEHNLICTDNCKDYKVITEKHIDSNKNAVCDACGENMYKIEYSPSKENGLTNQDVTVKITVYDVANNKFIEKNKKYEKNNINLPEKDQDPLEFMNEGFKLPEAPVVDHINKSVTGIVINNPATPGPGPVTAKFYPDYERESYGESYSKTIEVLDEYGNWQDAAGGFSFDEPFYTNGYYEFSIRDSVGNENKIPIIIDFISHGQATNATTMDVLENGTVFTDVLINTAKEWTVDSTDIKVKIYKISEGSTIEGVSATIAPVDQTILNEVQISKIEVKDFNENKLTDPSIGRGIYYIKIGIGGPGVFTVDNGKSTRYIVELDYVKTTEYQLKGKNRIEVTVNKLNNLT